LERNVDEEDRATCGDGRGGLFVYEAEEAEQ